MGFSRFIGACMVIAGAFCALPAQATLVLVEDFEDHTLGAAIDADANWTSTGGLKGTIIADGGGQAAQLLDSPTDKGYMIGLGAQAIADNTTGTLFFRTRSATAPWFQLGAYLSDKAPGAAWWDADSAGFYSKWDVGDGTAMVPRWDAGGATDLTGAAWYNVWVVANNTADTYDLHISQGTDNATGDATSVTVGSGIAFGSTTDGDLANFFITAVDNNVTTGGVIDDLYVDTAGINLANPVAIPETSSFALVGLVFLGFASRKRRS